MKNCDLYRHYDRAGNLLYVGISLSTVARLAQHRNCSDWYCDIAKITIEKFPDSQTAARAERNAIKNEKPLHNKAHAVTDIGAQKHRSKRGILDGVPHWSIRRWMVCWTPNTLTHETHGTGQLVMWPDFDRVNRSWTHAAGACDMIVHEFSQIERQHWVLSSAMGLVLSGELHRDTVHELFWPILEYRLALPCDTKAPDNDKRFGKYAGDTDAESEAA